MVLVAAVVAGQAVAWAGWLRGRLVTITTRTVGTGTEVLGVEWVDLVMRDKERGARLAAHMLMWKARRKTLRPPDLTARFWVPTNAARRWTWTIHPKEEFPLWMFPTERSGKCRPVNIDLELHGLLRDREGARDDGLAGDNCRQCGEDDERQPRPVRRHQIEGVLDRLRVTQDQCRLPQIIEEEAREGDVEPRDHDRLAPEMAHIGIERLRAGHRQHNRSQRQEGEHGIEKEKVDRVPG